MTAQVNMPLVGLQPLPADVIAYVRARALPLIMPSASAIKVSHHASLCLSCPFQPPLAALTRMVC